MTITLTREEIPEGLKDESPEVQVAWFSERPKTVMKWREWEKFYCSSVSHRGPCCQSCLDDADYDAEHGTFYYDDSRCCCKAAREESTDVQ